MTVLRIARCGEGMFEGGMWIFYVEMLVVLALGGFIVWWTLPRKKTPPERRDPPHADSKPGD